MSENPIVLKDDSQAIIVYICPTCLKAYTARRESDYYLKMASDCCVISYQPKHTPKHEPFEGHCFDDAGNFYSDIDDARDQGATWVTEAVYYPYEISMSTIIENMLEDHHEDASASDLQGLDELEAAIDAFNARQNSGSYYEGRRQMKIPHTKTFTMVKPCAVEAGKTEEIVNLIEDAGYTVEARTQAVLKRTDAEDLYDEHREKAHFNDLVDFTISGPAELLIISGGDNTPEDFRAFAVEKIRPAYAETQRRNGIHASDSAEASAREMEIFEGYFR